MLHSINFVDKNCGNKEIYAGELLVIVEYCRFGNLQTYLINHRSSFINLVDEFGNIRLENEMEYVDIVSKYHDTFTMLSQIIVQKIPLQESSVWQMF